MLARILLVLTLLVAPSHAAEPDGGVAHAPTPLLPFQHPVRGCLTRCGLSAPNASPQQCASLAEAEVDIIVAYHMRSKPSLDMKDMCRAVSGYTLIQMTSRSWDQPGKGVVVGLHICSLKQIFLGAGGWDALAHEFGHVWDCEILRLPESGEHTLWTSRGYCKAINSLGGLQDDCTSADYN